MLYDVVVNSFALKLADSSRTSPAVLGPFWRLQAWRGFPLPQGGQRNEQSDRLEDADPKISCCLLSDTFLL